MNNDCRLVIDVRPRGLVLKRERSKRSIGDKKEKRSIGKCFVKEKCEEACNERDEEKYKKNYHDLSNSVF